MKRERRDIFVWICLIAVVTLFRYVTVLADFYALHIYPYISYVLSLEASVISYSLEEIVVLFIVFVFIVNIIRSATKRITWKECFRKEFKLMALTYVWFYIGWGINYSRSSLTERVEVEKEEFDKDAFMSFLSEYTDSLNSLYVEQVTYQPVQTEAAIKDYFQSVPKKYGLCKPRDWHHSKRTLLNGLYSGSGVYGFMGPFFNESQLNSDLLPVQYPFTMAHEYSHLLGVSNEAEANWWAFQACSSQKDSTTAIVPGTLCSSMYGTMHTGYSTKRNSMNGEAPSVRKFLRRLHRNNHIGRRNVSGLLIRLKDSYMRYF